MDGLCIAAIIAGAVGLIGGILWGWGATRTAARVAVKVVTGTKNEREELSALKRRVKDLERERDTADTGHGT